MNELVISYYVVVALCFVMYLILCVNEELRLVPMHFMGFMGASLVPILNIPFLMWCLYYTPPLRIGGFKSNSRECYDH